MKLIKYYFLVALLPLLLSSCGDESKWKVRGSVEDGAGKTLLLEGSNQGMWYVIDSLELDKGGKFEFAHAPAGYPDVYRLTLDGKSIYFPVDSVETIEVKVTGSPFDRAYTLEGSPMAASMAEIDRKIMDAADKKGEACVYDSLLRREVSGVLLGDPSSVLAYYLINKRVGNTPLFNPAVKGDVRIIGAVANAFSTQRPNDPRTKYLTDLYLRSRRALSTSRDTMNLTEVPLIDFVLPDVSGRRVSLSSLASKGKVVVLNFTLYDAPESPAYNMKLSNLYKSLHERGLEIVQVSVDADHVAWSNSARNLPWVTLYAPEADRAGVLMGYNVTMVPTSFIINRHGEIVKRVDDVDELARAVEKYL